MNASASHAAAPSLLETTSSVLAPALLDYATWRLNRAHSIMVYLSAMLGDCMGDTVDEHHGVEAAIGIASRLAREVADNHERYAGVVTINNPDFDWVLADLYPAIGLMTILSSRMWDGEARFIVDSFHVLSMIEEVEAALKKVLDLLTSPPVEPVARPASTLMDLAPQPCEVRPSAARAKSIAAATLHAIAS
jgi:hypothetical protein